MSYDVKVPEVSEGVSGGIVVSILVAVNESVAAEQALLELETDKAVVEIPSPRAGKILEITVAEGDTVKTGDVIIKLDDGAAAGPDDSDEEADQSGVQAAAAKDEVPEQAEPAEKTDTPEKSLTEAVKPAETSDKTQPAETRPIADAVDLKTVRRGDDVAPAAPSVRRKARELGVDIYQVTGTGPAGRISKADIRTYVRQTMQRIGSAGAGLPVGRPLPDFTRWGSVSLEPLSRIRQLTAENMSTAWSTIPMVAQTGHARIGAFENFRKEFNSQADPATKLTMTALLVKICAAALRQFPQFNSSLDPVRQELILKQYIHIGVAVDTPSGLLVPVLRDADKKDIDTLARELNEMAGRTRERKLKPEEMEGGCFTISNLGGIGRDAFTPIVLPPQVAILGVARGRHEPVWNGHDFVPELMLPLTLTYDHRVIDGADGARFMQWICQAIEYPLQLVTKG